MRQPLEVKSKRLLRQPHHNRNGEWRIELIMSILLARHGETDWNIAGRVQGTTDIPLNENGKKQAEFLYENLVEEKINLGKIYSSYQKRALTTARIVGSKYHVPVEVIQGLEELNLGLFEGHTWDEILMLYPSEHEKWEANKRYTKAPRGESYQDLLNRFFIAYDQILEDAQLDIKAGHDILIVTHGAVIMSLLTIKNNLDFKTSYAVIKVENAKAIKLELSDFEEIRRKLH